MVRRRRVYNPGRQYSLQAANIIRPPCLTGQQVKLSNSWAPVIETHSDKFMSIEQGFAQVHIAIEALKKDGEAGALLCGDCNEENVNMTAGGAQFFDTRLRPQATGSAGARARRCDDHKCGGPKFRVLPSH